jgi:formamidopyrimidine-DNA glycosylase
VPELPEVETIRQNLEREIQGKRLTEVEIRGTRVARRHSSKNEVSDAVAGARISSIDRRGKYLVLRLDNSKVLVIHLGMSGRLEKSTPRRKVEKHTHAIFRFGTNLEIRFVDPRTFGEIFAADAEDLEGISELAHIALDPLADAFTWTTFSELVESRKVKLKQLLLDQSFVSGLGNIYSDEVLWSAGLLPERRSDTLTAMEMRRLYRAMQEVLIEAVKAGGTTLGDESYVNLYGQPGTFQEQLRAYGREGQACKRCRQQIVRAKWSNRSMFFCSSCQV